MMKDFILAHPYEVFTLLTIAGALYHWIQKAAKGEASFNPVDYWLKESPGYTAGTLVALICAWWFVVANDLLDGVKWQIVVSAGILCGYTFNSAISAGSGAVSGVANGARQGGYALPRLLLSLSIAAFLATGVVAQISGCGSAQVKTKNEANAFGYYTIGTMVEGIEAAYRDKRLTWDQANVLRWQAKLGFYLQDVARDPKNVDYQAGLSAASEALTVLSFNGKPALSPSQAETVRNVLSIAAGAAAGGPLPSSQDTAGWMLLSSNLLRTVSEAAH